MIDRPPWAQASALTRTYYDEEWGRKTTDEAEVFEAMSLLVFQGGLTWHTVLKHREALRVTFSGFDPQAVASLSAGATTRRSPLRNLRKVCAVIDNAQAATAVADQGGLSGLLWSNLEASDDQLARLLKKFGFKSLGPRSVSALRAAIGATPDSQAAS